MRLAVLLTSGPESRDWRSAYRLAEAALAQGHQVTVFLMVDGVKNAARMAGLSARGAHVMWCSHSAQQRGVKPVTGVIDSSQYEWSRAVAEADRVIGFS
jgi:sulfur relay (sulfurtransferase) complex TusBCD TusD component (DsrE family)